jgi:hypothetical protein
MALNDDILTRIQELDRRLKNLERNPQPPNISSTSVFYATFTLQAAGTTGDTVTITANLTDNGGKRIFAVPIVALFKNTFSTPPDGMYYGDRYPNGSSWSAQDVRDIDFVGWADYAETDYLSDTNLVCKYLVRNKKATTITLIFIGWYRFQSLKSTVS